MDVIAITTNQTLWWITLGAGLVVALLVWFLLEWLRRSVREVERAVERVWTMGKRVAQNTSTSHALASTKELSMELLAEVERHGAAAETERRER